jgi:hypothetical protein
MQGVKIQDANRDDWIFFQYYIDVTKYKLGQGFQATYALGIESYNTTLHCKKKQVEHNYSPLSRS